MGLLLVLILATTVTVALIPLLERRAVQLHVLDEPGARKVHTRPVPRVGGIAMAIGVALPSVLALPLDRLLAAFLAGAAIVLSFGVWDDRRDLRPAVKLLGQLVAVSLVVFVGGVRIDTLNVATHVQLPAIVSYPLTVLFLLGVTNAINLADGLDGLAGGTTLLCFAAAVTLALSGQGAISFVTVVGCAAIGSLLGFLRFNSYPARIFMGDGGSQLLGYTVGVVALVLTQDPELPYSAALPLLLLGLPILDTLAVIAIRLREGRSPFSADKNHLHHRLLGLGFDQFEAVVVIYLLQGVLFVSAWLMRYQSDVSIVLVFAAFAAALLLGLLGAERRGWRWEGFADQRLGAAIAERLPWLRAPERLPRWTNVTAWACVSLYVLAIGLTSTTISADVSWLAGGIAALLLVAALRFEPHPSIERLAHGAVFVAMVMVVYLDHIEPARLPLFKALKLVILPLLAAAVVVRIRFARERRFAVTTLDVLVVFMALVLPNLPGLSRSPSNLGVSIGKLIILLYAVEMLAGHSDRVRAWLWGSTAAGLAVLAVRGLWPGAG